jgi:hypothetical protein
MTATTSRERLFESSPAMASRLADLSGLTVYELRNVLQHLRDAELEEDLHRLLGVASAQGRNAWHESLVAAGLAFEYTEAISLAWDCARAASRRAVRSGQQPLTIALEVRYALIASSLNSSSASIPTEIVSAAAVHGMVRSIDLLQRFRQLPEPSEKLQALKSAVEHLSLAQLDLALEEAEALPPFYRVCAIAAIAPRLRADDRARIVERAASIAAAIEFQSTRIEAMLILAPLSEADRHGLVRRAAALVGGVPAGYERISCLAALLRAFEPEERSFVADQLRLHAVSQIASGSETHVHTAIAALAECGFVEQAEQLFADMKSEAAVGAAIEAFAPFCRSPQAHDRAFQRACTFDNPYTQVSAWVALAPQMTADMAMKLLAMAESKPLKRWRSLSTRVTVGLLRILNPRVVDGMWATTSSFVALEVRVATVAAMHLCALGRTEELGHSARKLKDRSTKQLVDAIEMLERSRDDAGADLTPAIRLLLSYGNDAWRADLLAYVAPRCRVEHWRDLVSAAVASGAFKGSALRALSPYMPPEVLAGLLAGANIGDDKALDTGIATISKHLSPTASAKLLPDGEDFSLSTFRRAAEAAAMGKPDALFELLPSLPRELQEDFAASNLVKVRYEQQQHLQAYALGRLAPFMSVETQHESLALINTFALSYDRQGALRRLAPHLHQRLITQARSMVDSLDQSSQEGIKTLLACRLADCGNVKEAQVEVSRITEKPKNRIFAILTLLPHIPPDQRQASLDIALNDLEALEGKDRLEYFALLAPFRPLHERLDAIEECLTADLFEPLVPLVPDLPLEKGYEIWNHCLSAAALGSRSKVVETLQEIVPVVVHFAGTDGISECVRAMGDVRTWWP